VVNGLQGSFAWEIASTATADNERSANRFLLTLESLDGTDEEEARPIFETRFGNTVPMFHSVGQWTAVASQGLHGLTRLSVWWMRLGIVHERIEPGHPEQKGSRANASDTEGRNDATGRTAFAGAAGTFSTFFARSTTTSGA